MEQKKILWVTLGVSLFFAVICGVAWYLYSPSRLKNRATFTKVEPQEFETPQKAGIDPDAYGWSKNSNEVPNPESSEMPAININNTLTVVSGSDENVDAKSAVDVSGLTGEKVKIEGSLPKGIGDNLVSDTTDESTTNSETASVDNATKNSDITQTEKQVAKTAETTKTKSSGVKKIVPAKTDTSKKVASKKTANKTTTSVNTAKPKTSAPKSQSKSYEVYWVQTASLTSRLYAEEARRILQEKNMKAEIFTKETITGLVHRVRIGPFSNQTEANYWLKSVKQIDGFKDSYVSKEKVES